MPNVNLIFFVAIALGSVTCKKSDLWTQTASFHFLSWDWPECNFSALWPVSLPLPLIFPQVTSRGHAPRLGNKPNKQVPPEVRRPLSFTSVGGLICSKTQALIFETQIIYFLSSFFSSRIKEKKNTMKVNFIDSMTTKASKKTLQPILDTQTWKVKNKFLTEISSKANIYIVQVTDSRFS